MIKTTIQNGDQHTKMRFPCSETEMSKRLGELGMNTENLAPVGTVTEIEPSGLSMIKDREVSLDALNYLGKRISGMDKRERNQFLAALSCAGFEADRGLKDIINLTYNLARFTLIEDTDDVVRVGRTHMLNIRGGLSESDYNNSKWPHYATQNAAEEGMKLLKSGSGIDTEYGKIYVNKDVPFEQVYNGTTFPAYWCEADSVAGVIIGYGDLTEFVELPCEDISIRKALCRLGADSINDCSIEIDDIQDIDDCMEKIREVEKTKDLFGLNTLLKNGGIHITAEPSESIFSKEVTRRLSENSFTVSKADDSVKVLTNDGFEVKISENGMLCIPGGCPFESYSQIEKIASEHSLFKWRKIRI